MRLLLLLSAFFIVQLTSIVNLNAQDPIVARKCPVAIRTPTLETSDDVLDYISRIETFLNQGGSIGALRTALLEQGLTYDPNKLRHFNFSMPAGGGVWETDVDADGDFDVLVNIFGHRYIDTMPASLILFYRCDFSRFVLFDVVISYLTAPAVSLTTSLGMNISDVADMNQDGSAEIVYHIGSCGVHTCMMDIRILSWNESWAAFEQLQYEKIMFAGGSYHIEDIENDGNIELIVQPGPYGSAGAGPLRDRQIIYAWDGENFVESDHIAGETSYRVHVALNGHDALMDADYDEAQAFFEKVFTDETLSDAPMSADYTLLSRATLKAYAAFNLMLIAVKQHGIASPESQSAYDVLLNAEVIPFPDDEESYSRKWIRYGQIFWETANSTLDLHQGCEAVLEAIVEDGISRDENGNSLGGRYYVNAWVYAGYDNEPPPPHEICPF